MSEPARKRASYEDLFHIPEHMTGQIVNGELIVTPRPSMGHAEATFVLGSEIGMPYRFGRGGPGGWIIYYEPELHLGENVLVPDLAGWRKERLVMKPDEHRFTVSPDWICEVLSRSTVRIDRVKKMPIYARYGVGHLWMVDPANRTLEVFVLREGGWLLLGSFAEDDEVRAEPFQEVAFKLGNLWVEEVPEPSPQPPSSN